MIRLLPERRPGLLPPAAAGEPWLMTVIAVLCFLACLAAVGAALTVRAALIPPLGWSAARLGIGEIVATLVVTTAALLTL